MIVQWIFEPEGPLIRARLFVGASERALSYTGTLRLRPVEWEAFQDAFVLGDATLLHVEPTSATLLVQDPPP